ncbi:MAG: glycosyltransferase family 4 protein [Verrucomicrobiae bacterium]|nr:glycosyltransferase family 4 protein [Verrucomicrobiae bacterium]
MSKIPIHVAHPGTQRGFRVAALFSRAGRLGSFWTTLAFGPGSMLGSRFPARSFGDIPRGRVRLAESWREWVSVLGARLPGYGSWSRKWIAKRNREFGWQVGARAGEAGDAVYGFDTASAEMFEAARARGLKLILDQTILHSVAADPLLRKVADRRPAYAGSLDWTPCAPGELARRIEEVILADRILCPSSAVRDSLILAGAESEKIRLVPFGVDTAYFSPPPERRGPVRFIFAGQLSERKGLGELLEAWKLADLADAELLLGGDAPGGFDWAPHIPKGARALGRLSRDRLREAYRACHCLVLPTWVEGQANVALEAMACGCAVLATDGAGLDGWLRHEETGMRLSPGEPQVWAEALRSAASDPARVRRWGQEAAAQAAEFSLEAYGRRLLAAVEDL